MTTLTVTLTLPDDIAHDADAFGLLRPEVIQRLICHEVERARTPVCEAPVLTEAQVDCMIRTGRARSRSSER